MIDRALAVFARAPEPGITKTRLVPLLGERGASDAHIELVEGTLARLTEVPAERYLWSTARTERTLAWAQNFNYQLCTQREGDIGARMADVFVRLNGGGAARVCLVGTDCPTLDARYVQAAFRELERTDVVLGPAEDGGYGLVATRAVDAALMTALFEEIPWSSAHVVARTTARLRAAGYTWTLLPELWDVDRPEDWRRYLDYCRSEG